MQALTQKSIRRLVLRLGRSALLRSYSLFGMADVLPLHYATNETVRGRALLSYRPSLLLNDKNHTGIIECQVMAEVLCNLGFNVDVYSCSDNINEVQSDSYDLIVGFGHPFRKAAQHKRTGTNTILYCTEGPPDLAKKFELAAIARITTNAGLAPSVIRHSELYLEGDASLADALLVLGDDTGRWASSGKPVHFLYPTGFRPVVDSNWIGSKKPCREIMWIGSSGVANKGLDLAFELARSTSATLHVLGVHGRRELMILRELVRRNPEVKSVNHGFLKYGSPLFTTLLKQSAACVLPSVSEGTPTGCLTACRNGLPTFVLQNCGLLQPRGGMQPCTTLIEMINSLNEVLSLSPSDYQVKSLNIYREANDLFSIQNFRRTFEQRVRSILQI